MPFLWLFICVRRMVFNEPAGLTTPWRKVLLLSQECFYYSVFLCGARNGSASVEKWAVEFTSSADSRPTKLVCQLTASSHLLDDSPGKILNEPIINPLTVEMIRRPGSACFHIVGAESSGADQRLYNVERYLCKTHKLLAWERSNTRQKFTISFQWQEGKKKKKG